MSQPALNLFVDCFKKVSDPRSKHGVSQPFRTVLADLQNVFAEFVNAILPDEPFIAAVDGKAAKQMTVENGDPILMLNVFAQNGSLFS